ncbi:MAG: class I SAM-dependent methyltransferase, partial [Myxococcota bacterium]
MDYDQTEMPESYDRGRRLADGVLDRWMAVVRQAAPASVRRVLDLGCGTGRFSGALADAFPRAAVIGVDPSTKMLAQARAKAHPRVRFVEGAGEAVPVSDGAVD